MWCISHILNLCLIVFSKTIAKHDVDIFKEVARITSYLNLNKANFRGALDDIGAADCTLIRKGEAGRFASFCQPVREMVARWVPLHKAAKEMVSKASKSKHKPEPPIASKVGKCKAREQAEPPAASEPVQGHPAVVAAAPAPVQPRRSTRANRCTTSMACDAFADIVDAQETRRMDQMRQQVDDGATTLEVSEHLLSFPLNHLLTVDSDDEDPVKVPKATRWSRTECFFRSKHMRDWCKHLDKFHEHFFLRAVEDGNSGCPLLPFRFRRVLLKWIQFLESAANGNWEHHHPNPRSENAFRLACTAFCSGLKERFGWMSVGIALSFAVMCD